jgi:hypothetical protein
MNKDKNDVYKKIKFKKKKIRDFNQVKCINDEFDIVKDKEIKNR